MVRLRRWWRRLLAAVRPRPGRSGAGTGLPGDYHRLLVELTAARDLNEHLSTMLDEAYHRLATRPLEPLGWGAFPPAPAADDEPAPGEPAHTEPAPGEPAHTEPAPGEPAHTEPAHTEPARPPSLGSPRAEDPSPPERRPGAEPPERRPGAEPPERRPGAEPPERRPGAVVVPLRRPVPPEAPAAPSAAPTVPAVSVSAEDLALLAEIDHTEAGLPARPVAVAWPVSVIMISSGRPEPIDAALASLRAQSYPDWELVVADTSGAPPPERPHAGGRLRVVSAPRRWAAAHDRALDAARGPLVAYVDEGFEVAPHWLRAAVAALEWEGVVVGHRLVVPRHAWEDGPGLAAAAAAGRVRLAGPAEPPGLGGVAHRRDLARTRAGALADEDLARYVAQLLSSGSHRRVAVIAAIRRAGPSPDGGDGSGADDEEPSAGTLSPGRFPPRAADG